MERPEERDALRLYLIKKQKAREAEENSIRYTLEAMNARIVDYQLEKELDDLKAEQAEASYGAF